MEKNQITVCLDPGHGPGCVNGSPDGSYKEAEFAWDMAQRIRSCLLPQGVNVVLTKEKEGYPSLTARADCANRAGVALFVSLHSNAVGGGWSAPNGLLIYTSTAGEESGRNRAARAILKCMAQAGVSIRGSGLLHEGYAVLVKTVAPAVLMEYGFHTNRSDVERLKSDAYRERLALATARGVCSYLELEWHEPERELSVAVERLYHAGIITSPDYWKAGDYSTANVHALIRSMARRV